MFNDVDIEKRKPTVIAYLEHEGSYNRIPYEEYHDKLTSWVKEKGLKPKGKMLAIYHDDPDETPAIDQRADVGIPIPKEVDSDKKVKVKKLPAMKVVEMKHKGPRADYEKTYSRLRKWIKKHKYKEVGDPIEIYAGKPKISKGKMKIKSKIQIPVEK